MKKKPFVEKKSILSGSTALICIFIGLGLLVISAIIAGIANDTYTYSVLVLSVVGIIVMFIGGKI